MAGPLAHSRRRGSVGNTVRRLALGGVGPLGTYVRLGWPFKTPEPGHLPQEFLVSEEGNDIGVQGPLGMWIMKATAQRTAPPEVPNRTCCSSQNPQTPTNVQTHSVFVMRQGFV